MICMIEIIKSPLRPLKRRIDARYNQFCVDHFPHRIIEKSWLRDFGYPIDWEHPRDINEKIQWLIAFSDTSEWSRLADKYLVRDYVASKGYANNLTKLYGVWKRAEDIDFDALPEKFVLKCNHDSGSYFIVDKQKGFNKSEIVKKTDEFLKRKFGYQYCEPHYNRIKPLVIAEEFLEDDCNFSSSLIDYKVWCFNGNHILFLCVMVAAIMENMIIFMTLIGMYILNGLFSQNIVKMDKVRSPNLHVSQKCWKWHLPFLKVSQRCALTFT